MMTAEEYQQRFNDRITTAIEKLTDTVSDLEKHTVILDGVVGSVKDHDNRIQDIERSMDFVIGAKRVFVALIIALVIGSATAVWQVAKDDTSLTKDDVILLLKAIKEECADWGRSHCSTIAH